MKCPKCRTVNSEDSQYCKKCATPLPLDEGQVSFTRTLETTPDELTRGTTFAGRYEIIEELGAGGMGKVYRAFDKQLDEEVALKLIKPEIAAEKKTVERFRNEIKIARKITHKNVCRTHDLGEEGKALFITMEYIQGEDLKSLIRRTRALTAGTAISIAQQVAEGLGEAHRLGIVHRDLKPGNVMIDKDGNAKIMDFGIARLLTGGGTTAEGAIIGTPEYMSPEQVDGKPADARADIYALGVILYEMVTGRPPFEGETAFAIANKHRSEPAPDPRELNPQLPLNLSRLILRCLEKEKEARYQSTAELLTDLEAVEATLPATDRAAARTPSKTKPKTSREITVKFTPRKLIIPTLALVALAVYTVIFVWKPWKGRGVPLPAGDKAMLAILNFENTSQDESLDDWKTGLPLLLTTDLSQSRYLFVVSYDQTYGILKNLGLEDSGVYSSDDLARIAREARAAYTATGSIMRVGERILVVLSIKNNITGDVHPVKFECVGEVEIPSLADSIGTRIKEILGLTRSQISSDFDALAVDISTNSVEAFKLYNEGRRMHLAQRYEESIPLMLQAIEKDPEFALAYRSLAASLSTQGRSDEARRYIQLALEHSGNSSPKERFWIQIDYYSQSQLTYDKALEACRNWLDLYPDDTQALMLTGRQYLLSEDFELALKYLDASVQNGDVNPWTFYWLALAYNISGAYEKGRQASLLGLRIHPAHSLIEECLFDSYVSQGKIPEAQAWLDKWALKNPGLSTDLKRGDLFILQGGRDEAATILNKYDPAEDSVRRSLLFLSLSEGKIDEAIEMARAGDNHLWLTYLSYRAGRFQEALAESQKALQDALEQGNLRNQAWTLLIRGLVELAMGSMDAAEQTAGELGLCVKAAPIQKIVRYHHFLLGIIERESGRFSDAIDNFTKAIALLPRESWESGLSWECLFFDGLAQTYYKSGDLDRAKETYRKIQSLPFARLRYGDIHARSFYWLGRIAEQKGRKSEATEQYRKFVDLWKDADPGLSEVEDAKKRLVGLKVQ